MSEQPLLPSTLQPASLPPFRVLVGWAVAIYGIVAGVLLSSDLPSPAAPLLAWAAIGLGTLLAGSALPVGIISTLFAFELLRSILATHA